jgi:dynein light chain roadblock-type
VEESRGPDYTKRECLADLFSRQDGLKLLRLRTKKQEIVIVPDTKYLLTVVHDTPPA